MKKRTILFLILALLIIAALISYLIVFPKLYASNVRSEAAGELVYIAPGDEFETVVTELSPYLENQESFRWVADLKNYPEHIKAGRYRLSEGMSNLSLLNTLRSGAQEPLNVVVVNVRDEAELAGLLGDYLARDSSEFLNFLRSDSALKALGIDRQNLLGAIIPNTYEFYWTASPKKIMQRLKDEAEKYWQNKSASVEAHSLSRSEIITLASIVESETVKPDEMPEVAGLYLNRLERKMLLQSDPTVIYGHKMLYPDSVIKRVLYQHLRLESPYNTYRNSGLPPGPIRISSKKAYEAVLNPGEHNYLYMVADPKRPGYHLFGRNLAEHNRNKQAYLRWIRGRY